LDRTKVKLLDSGVKQYPQLFAASLLPHARDDLAATGADLRVIQALLDHAEIRSTTVHTQVGDAQLFRGRPEAADHGEMSPGAIIRRMPRPKSRG
jgi:hypothetical protein